MSEIGINEAIEWLVANGDGWVFQSGKSELRAGASVGDPTRLFVTVTLVRDDTPDVWLTGEGSSLLEAVQVAVGSLRDA